MDELKRPATKAIPHAADWLAPLRVDFVDRVVARKANPAPAIFFHGSTDTVVDPATSLLFKSGLEARGIPHLRVIYDTTGFSTGDTHSIQNVPALNSDMLAQWQAWLVARGVLPP